MRNYGVLVMARSWLTSFGNFLLSRASNGRHHLTGSCAKSLLNTISPMLRRELWDNVPTQLHLNCKYRDPCRRQPSTFVIVPTKVDFDFCKWWRWGRSAEDFCDVTQRWRCLSVRCRKYFAGSCKTYENDELWMLV